MHARDMRFADVRALVMGRWDAPGGGVILTKGEEETMGAMLRSVPRWESPSERQRELGMHEEECADCEGKGRVTVAGVPTRDLRSPECKWCMGRGVVIA